MATRHLCWLSIAAVAAVGSGGAVLGPGLAEATSPGTNGKIAFTRGGGSGALEIIDPDGGNLHQLQIGVNYHVPAWSADGTKLVVGDGGVFSTMFADGSGLTTVPNASGSAQNPSWSPDGARLVYDSVEAPVGLTEVNVDGTNVRYLGLRGQNPVWSPDCLHITYWDAGPNGSGEIYVAKADGTDVHQLTNDPATDYRPDWSPDGTKIAWVSGRTGLNQIWTMNADGTNQQHVPGQGGQVDSVRYSPDGLKFVMSTNRSTGNTLYDIQTSDIGGTNFQRLTVSPHLDLDPSWQPLNGPAVTCPTPAAAFTASNTTAPTGHDITFDGTGSTDPGGTLTYSWDYGDGQAGNGSAPSHAYARRGDYTVRLTVTNGVGLHAETSRSVTITDRPPVAVIGPPPAPPYLVAGKAIRFASQSSDPDGTIVDTRWVFDDGQSSTEINPLHTFATTGIHTVKLIVTDDDGNTDAITTDVHITTDPPPTVTVSAAQPRATINAPVHLSAAASDVNGTITTYRWDFGDGTSITSDSADGGDISHAYGQPGTYSPSVTVTDDDGHTATAQTSLEIDQPLQLRPELPANDARALGTTPTITWTSTDGDGSPVPVTAEVVEADTLPWDSAPRTFAATTSYSSGPGALKVGPLENGSYAWRLISSSPGTAPTEWRLFTVGPDLAISARAVRPGLTLLSIETTTLDHAELTISAKRRSLHRAVNFSLPSKNGHYVKATVRVPWTCEAGSHTALVQGTGQHGSKYAARTTFRTDSCAHRWRVGLEGRHQMTTKQQARLVLEDRWKQAGTSYRACVTGPVKRCMSGHTPATGKGRLHFGHLPVGHYRVRWQIQGRTLGPLSLAVKAPPKPHHTPTPSRHYCGISSFECVVARARTEDYALSIANSSSNANGYGARCTPQGNHHFDCDAIVQYLSNLLGSYGQPYRCFYNVAVTVHGTSASLRPTGGVTSDESYALCNGTQLGGP